MNRFVENMTGMLHGARRQNKLQESRKLDRDRAEFNLNEHRGACRRCEPHGISELINGAGCAEGQTLAIVFQIRNRALSGGGQ